VTRFALLPRFPGSVITVRSVLDMHSGIPGDINNGSFTAGRPYPGYEQFLLRTLAKEYPERRVNTAYAYSNSGYALLQNLVQNVTGQNFATYTRRHLFGPMGMTSTTFNDASVPGSALTHGYQAVVGADGAVHRESAGAIAVVAVDNALASEGAFSLGRWELPVAVTALVWLIVGRGRARGVIGVSEPGSRR
jgi:CubicO group peptidase (beta-lactamase class C family)